MKDNTVKHFCIVSYCNIYLLPYAKIYIDSIIDKGASCTLLFWDRDLDSNRRDDPESKCELITFHKVVSANSKKSEKILGYIRATRFFNRILRKNDYDGVVVLQSHAAVLCKNVLLQKYNGKYIVDVRDYSFEDNRLFKRMESIVIRSAYQTVISSPAYKSFLPKGEYVIAHNYSSFSEKEINLIRNRKINNTINITFVGTIRFLEMDFKILSLFKNDYRFQLNYYGNGSDILRDFCEKNDIKNVDFFGSFSPERTIDFYREASLINNLYGNHDNSLDYAISNKLYHACQLYIPILVCPDTYMEKIVLKNKIGFVFDVNKQNEPDRLFKWFKTIKWNELEQGCNQVIAKAKSDNKVFLQMLDNFVHSIENS